MAFKKLEEYNSERYDGFFILRDDGEFKDVIPLYQSVSDVLIADTHYIKSPEYSGYVHCTGRGCPACAKGIRVQSKLFIPLYDIENDEVVFWDRNSRFEQQLSSDILTKYPDPSQIVFRITRHGKSGDVETKYQISAIAKNTTMSYAAILASKGITMPEHYDVVCKEFTAAQLHTMLDSDASVSSDNLGEYNAKPRGAIEPNTGVEVPGPGFSSAPAGITIPDSDSDDEEDPDF